MDFDSRALLQVAQIAGVPESEAVQAVAAALKDAYDASPDAKQGVRVVIDPALGTIVLIDLEGNEVVPPGFGARATMAARQAMVSWVRNLERVRKVGRWATVEGHAIRATVKTITRDGETRLDADGTVAVMPAGESVPNETLTVGQPVWVLLLAANVTGRDTVRLTVSRRQPALVTEMFAQRMARPSGLVQGLAQIVSVAREPGVRTKVAVAGPGSNPISDFIGPMGSLVRAVSDDLGGEPVDLVRHNSDLAKYAAAALSPAVVSSAAVVDATRKAIQVSVTPDQAPAAEGTDGVNLRLASRLTGARIGLVTLH